MKVLCLCEKPCGPPTISVKELTPGYIPCVHDSHRIAFPDGSSYGWPDLEEAIRDSRCDIVALFIKARSPTIFGPSLQALTFACTEEKFHMVDVFLRCVGPAWDVPQLWRGA